MPPTTRAVRIPAAAAAGRPLAHQLRTALDEFIQDGGSRMGAAMAYYTLFVMAPAVLLLAAISMSFLGSFGTGGSLGIALEDVLGKAVAGYVFSLAATTVQSRAHTIAGVAGGVTLVWAIVVFYWNTQAIFNRLWRVESGPGMSWSALLRSRAKGFMILLLPVVLLAAAAVLTAVLSAVTRVIDLGGLGDTAQRWLGYAASPLLLFALACLSFTLMYKLLPEVRASWWISFATAVVVAAAWTVGTWLFGLYVSWSGKAFAYGAVSALFVLLVWLNYSARIVFLGCKFTKVRTEAVHGRVEPLPHMVAVRIEQQPPVTRRHD